MDNKVLLPKLKIIPNKLDNISKNSNDSSPLIRLSNCSYKAFSNFASTGNSKISYSRSTSLQQ